MSKLGKEGKHYQFLNIEFWAEDGLIFIEDHRKDDFHIESRIDFIRRAAALSDEVKRTAHVDARTYMQTCVEEMIEACKEAKHQGDPMDPKIARQKYKERRKAIMVTGLW